MSVEIISFGNVPKFIEEGNELAILEVLINVTARAKENAPVDLGELRNSIMYRKFKEQGGFNEGSGAKAGRAISPKPKPGTGVVGSAVAHAIYNEFGTRKLAAQPFLRPAVAAVTIGGQVQRWIKRFQTDSVRKGLRRGPRKKKVLP